MGCFYCDEHHEGREAIMFKVGEMKAGVLYLFKDQAHKGRCALAQPWLWVDHTGRRFFNESRGSVFVDVYNAMTSAGGVSYTIFDQAMMDRLINQGAVLPFNAIVLAGTPLKARPKTWEIGQQRG